MTTILAFIFTIGILIFIHELGHFLAARAVGIKVERFSVGFPPYVFNLRRGETSYSIGLIPLGGFVKMKGENPDEQPSGDKDDFQSKSVGQRALVIFAGPFMNYILAIFLLMTLFYVKGMPEFTEPSTTIEDVGPGGPAESAGIRPNDTVIAVDGQPVADWRGLASIINGSGGRDVTIGWVRGSDTMSATMPTIVGTVSEDLADTSWIVGIQRKPTSFQPLGFGESITHGFRSANVLVGAIFVFLYDYATGQISADMVGGPVYIAQQAGKDASKGAYYLFRLMALLSLNLAVLNILPIPVLDGGHLVFLGIEKIKGGPLSLKFRGMAQQVGIVFLLLFIAYVTFNDISRIF